MCKIRSSSHVLCAHSYIHSYTRKFGKGECVRFSFVHLALQKTFILYCELTLKHVFCVCSPHRSMYLSGKTLRKQSTKIDLTCVPLRSNIYSSSVLFTNSLFFLGRSAHVRKRFNSEFFFLVRCCCCSVCGICEYTFLGSVDEFLICFCIY